MSGRWRIGAVLLDMDGTLIDTERVHIDSLSAVLTTFGYADVTSVCHAMIGLDGVESRQVLLDHYGDDLPLEAINRAFIAHRADTLRGGLPLKPGALELLDALRGADCAMALVTSSSRKTAEQHLTLAGIRPRFGTMLTRDDVTRGKPSPELYMLAARTLGQRPGDCIAIEDSNVGVAAAHAAGAITLMVPDILPPKAETRDKCAAVLPDLHAALALLQARGLGFADAC